MLTAFGYDWVPGNLAGGLALERAGDAGGARRHRLLHHRQRRSMSGGTMASLVGALAEPAFGFRDGRVQTERGAKRVRSFDVGRSKLRRRLGGQLGALRACRAWRRSCAR